MHHWTPRVLIGILLAFSLVWSSDWINLPRALHATPASAAHADIDRFQFDAAVSAADRQDIVEGVRLARAFFAATFGADLGYSVTVLARNAGGPVEARMDRSILVPIWGQGWARAGVSREVRAILHRQTMVHELFHFLQADLGDDVYDRRARERESVRGGPGWLLEGSAELVGYQALAWAGMLSIEQVIACTLRTLASSHQTPPLRRLETKQSFNEAPGTPYGIALLAVDFLVRRTNVAALQTYFGAVTVSDWEGAFTAAFGIDIAAFYEAFEQYRAALPPPSRTVCDWQAPAS